MSEETGTATPEVQETGQRFDGRVKWFNNKAGYGFVTASSGPNEGEDIFVHHSALTVTTEQYKYLVQGEYVELTVLATEEDSDHKWQASDVRGVKGGKLMCETRNESREARNANTENVQRPPRRTRNTERPRDDGDDTREWKTRSSRRGGRGPRSVVDENGVEWMLVRKTGEARRGGNVRRKQYQDE